MIYVGVLSFSEMSALHEKIAHVLQSVTQSMPHTIQKDSLFFCSGYAPGAHQFDQVWQSDSAILIGRFFDRDPTIPLTEEIFRRSAAGSTKALLKKLWGTYLFLEKTTETLEVVIDTTGQLPFFYHRLSDGTLLFSSHIDLLQKIVGQIFASNWSYLCSYLLSGNNSTTTTPFQDVDELPPGCQLTFTQSTCKTTLFWNPRAVYSVPHTPTDAVEVLQAVLKPWIDPYKITCVSLSGGLDSSALVYCLKDILGKDQTLKALNYFHGQIQSSNELRHARKVCQETGIELIEVDVSDALPFDPPQYPSLLKSNKPCPGMISTRWTEVISERLFSQEPVLFISGHGSDHIFMRPPSKKLIADYILEKGFKGIQKEFSQLTDYFRDSFFSIFKENAASLVRYLLKRQLAQEAQKHIKTPAWIQSERLPVAAGDLMHPFYDFTGPILPGKYEQIEALYGGLASIHREDMHLPSLTYYPFLMRPVVEFALLFSTYQLFDEGYDRYPLRKAVSERFNTETVWRRDKSETTGIMQLGIKKNFNTVLELCLEGKLVKQGLIDREACHQTITLLANGDTQFLWCVLNLASLELFLREW